MHKLIDNLTAQHSLQTNLGASSIINDLMDDRESRELFMALDESNLKKVC